MEWLPERSAASMSHDKAASGGRAAKKPGRSLVVPILAVVAACLVFILNVVLFVGWYRTKRTYDGLQREKAQLEASNRVLADAYGLLHNKRVQICNRSPVDVTIHWVSVIYEDAGRLKSFNSQRCEDWVDAPVKAGASRMLTLSSTQEGCNWNGSVVFFAMHYSRGETQAYSYAGAWMDFDKDCYTVQ
jgi:hypothetical protein